MRSRAGHSPRTAVRGSPGTQATGAVPVRHIRGWLQTHGNVRRRQMAATRFQRVQNPAYKPAQKYPAAKTAGYFYMAAVIVCMVKNKARPVELLLRCRIV